MFRKTAIAATLLSLCVVGSGASFACELCGSHTIAHEGHEHHDEKAVSPAVEVCPVSGDVLKGDEKYTYEYKGTTYRFCCPQCVEEFKKDPEKYIDKMKKKDEKKS